VDLPVEIPRRTHYNDGVPLTVEQIIEETRDWPSEKVEELIERLAENPHSNDPEAEAAWKTEINRRVEEIQSGQVQGIPGEEVSARIRKILKR
jgi:putative addiction module component (TIGR02574 family)